MSESSSAQSEAKPLIQRAKTSIVNENYRTIRDTIRNENDGDGDKVIRNYDTFLELTEGKGFILKPQYIMRIDIKSICRINSSTGTFMGLN